MLAQSVLRREKTCLSGFVLTSLHSLISTFVIRSFEGIIPKLASNLIAEQAGLGMIWLEIPMTGFLMSRPK